MDAKQAMDIVHAAIEDESGVIPFSNGSEGMQWFSENCERCKKALICYNPEAYNNMRDGGKTETLQGLNCFGEYAMAVSFITGKVPIEIVQWMGGEAKPPDQCLFFSDDDNNRPDRQPPPIDPMQLKIPFMCASLFGFDDPNVLVFDTAIVEADIFYTPQIKHHDCIHRR